jgi:hypothetical protein
MSELMMKIGRKQMDTLERLIALQMLGHSVIGCARILSVSRETIYQWMKNPLYIAMKERERSEFLTATGDAIVGAALDAVRHLQDVVTDFRIPKTDRVEAAQYLVELGTKFSLTKQPDKNAESFARMLFPEVVADEPEPLKELPAPAREQTFEELFNQLHEQPSKAGE